MAPIIIRSTRVVLPAGVQPAEIEIEGGRISEVRPQTGNSGLAPPGSRAAGRAPDVRDVGDLVVMPGIVDTHVHVNEPGRTEWEGFATATAAAAAGGITTLVDMPLNSVPATTSRQAFEAKRRVAPPGGVEVRFWGGVIPGNHAELDALADAGVLGFKCFLSPSGVEEFPAVSVSDLRRAMPILAARKLPLLAHAEWPPSLRPPQPHADPRSYATWLATRPPQAEVDAIALLVALCREYGTPVHIVHLATEAALPLLDAARAEGLPITVETCPHYLTFAAEDIPDGATAFKCAPPIRGGVTREALWRGLQQGQIDLIATDHSPCPPEMKGTGDFLTAWGGIASLELSLSAVWTGASGRGIGLESITAWLSAAPARLAGLDGRKGTIAAGKDADLTIWNPAAEYLVDDTRLRQRHKHTPYTGRRFRGRVIETYARGSLVYRDSGV